MAKDDLTNTDVRTPSGMRMRIDYEGNILVSWPDEKDGYREQKIRPDEFVFVRALMASITARMKDIKP